eukprot:CAMPEP_0177417616 /NCGR_PEP_ID=MMETSP0368-20130122/68754_1 /TAXON_ID=447022 ORGANISM="Scrippsiella hangoei-like, Strain SHHI-4" /NCGR_SAMPLE_ID=MMETSP0368 /ASSEMBLY_ACC=CAM_ASM_000363 /LENGTH=83 /DNA_ID=CAMNT_0018887227 /DNA_START=36 /DNA_END=285 /DNA_ORIENTATION=+
MIDPVDEDVEVTTMTNKEAVYFPKFHKCLESWCLRIALRTAASGTRTERQQSSVPKWIAPIVGKCCHGGRTSPPHPSAAGGAA